MGLAKKLILPGAVAAAGFIGVSGASMLTSLTANAASATTSTPSTSTSTTDTPKASMPAHGSASHEDTETAVTGDNATKAQAAAVKSVGSGTAGAVTSDYSKDGYETTVTKSDGTTVEVHLDSTFSVMQGGSSGGRPNDSDADDSSSTSSSTSSSASTTN